jgi:hypothetical protein
MENQPACWCRRVDVFGQGPEAGTARPDRLHNIQKVFQRSRQPVILGDSYNVTVSELV